MENKTIAFIGKAKSGKTTACTHILENYKGFTKVNFKDALVAELRQNFPDLLQKLVELEYPSRMFSDKVAQQKWIDQSWIDQLFLDKPPLMRALMQNYGTEVRRAGNVNYWVNEWVTTRKTLGDVLVDDCRFHNEAQTIRDHGGVIIKIVQVGVEDSGTHSSELEMEGIAYDYEIVAEKGDHASFYAQLNVIMQKIDGGVIQNARVDGIKVSDFDSNS